MENKTNIITGVAGGKHVTDGPLTTANITEASTDLLRSDIDERIVKIRPMSTPVDQISRMKGARKVNSLKVDYYSVDTKPTQAKAKSLIKEADSDNFGNRTIYRLNTNNNAIFCTSDTILVPSVTGNDGKPLMLYVVRREPTEAPLVIAVNWQEAAADTEAPKITSGTLLSRMGRAASELDVQTPQFSAVPVKDYNYCQIFKTQIEQSLYAKIAGKEVGWTFSDQEEVAVMDMRLGIEKNFIFGTRARLSNPGNYDDTLLTEGIWNQADNQWNYTSEDINESSLSQLMRQAFTGEAAGSSRKVLIAGSGLIARLSAITTMRSVNATDKVTVWGIDFHEIVSKFGSLYVIYSEVFDQCGHADDGLIIDPEYMTKYVHVPFRVDLIDMHKTGARNTRALVATESSCLVLRHPKSHVKVVFTNE